MDFKERSSSENWTHFSTSQHEMLCNTSLSNQSFTILSSHQQQNHGAPSVPGFGQLDQSLEKSSLLNTNSNASQILGNGRTRDWDPRSMLNNLSFLKQKIHQLQALIHMISRQSGNIPGCEDELLIQQQQLIATDLTSIIVQLISTAVNLLPSEKHSLSDNYVKSFEQPNCGTKVKSNIIEEEHEPKDDDYGKEENLPPGSYEIFQLEKEEILAPHTHFCTICGKGFKRDANLRMHMRGHGDEYKTTAALAKPNKDSNSGEVIVKRYSCPFVGCKRNKDHKKFQPLKTILCVKNHYKRTHCDKSYICSRCHIKKFSVIADLKTHEKHCGRDKWLCSCGTTFSRKDKLFGHIALFQGHTPAILFDDNKPSTGSSNPAGNSGVTDKVGNVGFGLSSNVGEGDGIQSRMDMKGNVEDPLFSLLNYDCDFGGLQEFLQGNFDDSLNPFSFLASEEKSVMECDSNDMDE